ncbi:MAG: hypothetical protein JW818_06830, partial [Pirellulales bacterium]|nr:hypothetical protein [Pirellulales bacterium]
RLRQGDQGEGSAGTSGRSPLALGLMFCLLSGVLSALVNFGLVFGEPLADVAAERGASEVAKNNAVWALIFTGNYTVNAVYALALMIRHRTLGLLVAHGTLGYWVWALFMGISWPLGIVFLGIGASKMGPYGAFVAFPMMLVAAILFGNLAGILTGEWRSSSRRARTVMAVGVAVLCLAFLIFGMAQHLLG